MPRSFPPCPTPARQRPAGRPPQRAELLLPALLLALLGGCDGDATAPTKPPLLGSPVPPLEVNCAGADLSALTSVVYASPGGDTTAACGGLSNPCASLQQAIDNCGAAGCGVLVGIGDFAPAQVTLRAGVHVIGNCRLRPEWDARWRSVLHGPAGGGAAVVADQITTPTRFEGLMVLAADGATWTRIAVENGSFSVSGTQIVRFGTSTSWFTMSVTGGGPCTNTFFGGDPAGGFVKECDLATGNLTWTRIAGEKESFTVNGTQVVRYGKDSTWYTRNATGSGQCDTTFFGGDPLFRVVKQCEVVGSASAGAPSVAMTVHASSGVTLLNSTLISARGADGALGDDAPTANRDGASGSGTTRGDSVPAAAGGQSPAGGGPGGNGGVGGALPYAFGGFVACPSQSGPGVNGIDGQGAPVFGGGTLAGGGGAGPGAEGYPCTFFINGAGGGTGGNGSNGARVPSAAPSPNQLGSLSGLAWIATFGSAGNGRGNGGNGGSGGGGGGPGGNWGDLVSRVITDSGGYGGGGGAGGAGGDPGGGGGQGGASIALLAIDSTFAGGAAGHGTLVAGPGGAGGNGGNASAGGVGGAAQGGAGGSSSRAGPGGPGGSGGWGSGGGGGAGGNGGPSIGMALSGTSPDPTQGGYIYDPHPGTGGAPGQGGGPSLFPFLAGPAGQQGKDAPFTYSARIQ